MTRPLLLGHRGARKYAPENTLAAFQAAMDDGCDGFEFDVRVTADGVAVICHDAKVAGVSVARGSCARLREKVEELATLDEVLESFGNAAFLNAEIKVSGAEETAVAALRKLPPKRGVIVSSFLPSVVRRMRELDAELELGIICENRRQLAAWKELPMQAVMVEQGLVSAKLVDEMKSAGKRVFVWTVNGAREMRKFAELGVDGIISDDTKLLVKTVG
jgi:glycerophosphoryl diester phosphodiesterase